MYVYTKLAGLLLLITQGIQEPILREIHQEKYSVWYMKCKFRVSSSRIKFFVISFLVCYSATTAVSGTTYA